MIKPTLMTNEEYAQVMRRFLDLSKLETLFQASFVLDIPLKVLKERLGKFVSEFKEK